MMPFRVSRRKTIQQANNSSDFDNQIARIGQKLCNSFFFVLFFQGVGGRGGGGVLTNLKNMLHYSY